MKEEEKKEISDKKLSKITIDLFGTEILERTASKFGTGAHVIIPRENIGKKIKIVVRTEKRRK